MFVRILTMPSVKYLQLILMNLTIAGLSSSEFGESSRRMAFAVLQSDVPSWGTVKAQVLMQGLVLALIFSKV